MSPRAAVAAAAVAGAVVVFLAWRSRQRRSAAGWPTWLQFLESTAQYTDSTDLTAIEAALAATPPPMLAARASAVSGRPWYREAIITDCSAACGLDTAAGSLDAVLGLHLGDAKNPPESLLRLRRPSPTAPWEPVPHTLLKRSLRFTLLAFCWLDDGFAPRSAALLLGCGGGALLHFWQRCVRGGDSLRCDACELDAAVIELAREYLCLGACETTGGGARISAADGAEVLASAADASYALVVCDLDMGTLLRDAAAAQHMRRILTDTGVLVVNDYSEDAPSDRLQATLRAVRHLRDAGFEEIHVLRTTPHNSMLIAPVAARGWGRDQLAAAAARLDLGVDVGALLGEVSERRYSVF